MEKAIRLTEEMFYGLLQGKKLQQVYHDGKGAASEWTIYPPHYGLYMTHSQIDEMRRAAYQSGARGLVELIESLTSTSMN